MMSGVRRDSISLNKLKFRKDQLYDRESEQKTLRDVYLRSVKNNNNSNDTSHQSKDRAIMVEGNSGVGKTSLVGTLRHIVEKRNDYFLSGKFDLQHQSAPHAAIVDALSELSGLLNIEETTRLRNSLGDEVSKVIVRCVPALGEVFSTRSSPSPTNEGGIIKREGHNSFGSDSRNKFNYAFQTFFRSICDNGDKFLVLFIDDLQWADPASLELLDLLINDKDNDNLLFIGAYRSNEVDEVHPLSARIREIERSGVNIHRLAIGNLCLDAIHTMISDALNMSTEETKSLAEVVHAKTYGNAYFTIQLLESLVADEILSYNFGSFKWVWDLQNISNVFVTSNVADLMLARLRKATHEEQTSLAVSSCLGSSFDLPVLILVFTFLQETMINESTSQHIREKLSFIKISANTVQSCMDKNLSQGLLSKFQEESIRFSHDQIKEAAFALIPEESKGILQWFIGQALIKKLASDQLSIVLFSAVDLLNDGRVAYFSLSSSEKSKDLVDLASLNLGAGRKAMEISAFRKSMTYLESAIEYIQLASGEEDVEAAWIQYPNFCLEAFQSLANSLSCIGDMDKTASIVNMILKHTASKEGRMNAYATLADAYGSQDETPKAFDAAFCALAEIGEKFPRNAGKGTIAFELLRMKLFMKKYPVESVRSLPLLKDRPRAIMMKIFVRLMLHAQIDCPKYMPLMTFRLVKWSCIYGVHPSASAAGFATYGHILAGVLGDLQAGYGYANIAMELAERSADKSGYSYTYAAASLVKLNQEPVINSIKGDLIGYQIGMEHGENFFAMCNIIKMLVNSYSSGRALFVVEADMRIYAPHSADKGQSYIFKRMQPAWQLVLILMGNEKQEQHDTPDCKLSGEVMDEDDFIAQNEKEPGVVAIALVNKQFLAYLCGNFELAGSLSDVTQGYPKKYGPGLFFSVRYTFFDALTSLALAKLGTGKKKWLKRATKNIKRMTSWHKKGNVNVSHMLLLLQAEEYTLNKKMDMQLARSKFDQAISNAAKAGFANDRALANERAGVFFLAHDDSLWASVYMARAHECWAEYGAVTISKLLEKRYPQFITTDIRRSSMKALNSAKRRVTRANKNTRNHSSLFKDASESWTSIRATSLASCGLRESALESLDTAETPDHGLHHESGREEANALVS